MAESDNQDSLPVVGFDFFNPSGPTLDELAARARQEFNEGYPKPIERNIGGLDATSDSGSGGQSRTNEWPNPGIPEEPVTIPDVVHPFRLIDASSGGNKVKVSAGSKLFDETGAFGSTVSVTNLDTAISVSSGDKVWVKATISGLSVTAAAIETGTTYTGYSDYATFSGGAQNYAFHFIGEILSSSTGVVDPITIGTVYGRQYTRTDLQAVVGAYDGQAAVLLRPF